MEKKELLEQLESGREQLKDYNRFIDILKDEDDPKGILTRLNQTLGRIEMLVKMNDIKEVNHPTKEIFIRGGKKTLVRVRPCNKKYNDKIYVGFLIGECALGSSIQILEDKIQLEFSGYNPAIFIPELGEVVYGVDSWWNKIKSVDELKEITNDDIENVWYVKMLTEGLDK